MVGWFVRKRGPSGVLISVKKVSNVNRVKKASGMAEGTRPDAAGEGGTPHSQQERSRVIKQQ